MNTPANVVSSSAFDFQRDLGRYWRHARKQGVIMLTQQGWIYKNSFKMLLAALNMQPDAPSLSDEAANGKLWFMRRLLVTMNELVSDNAGRALIANPESRLLSLPMAQRVKWTFEIWRDTGAWNELTRLRLDAEGLDDRRESPAALGRARLGVLRAIGRLAGGSAHGSTSGRPSDWQDTFNLISHLKRNDYQFLFERRHRHSAGGPGGLYSSPYYAPNNLYGVTFYNVKDEASGWRMIEQAFIVQVLTGPLHWMGLLELGYDSAAPRGENQMPQAYRLTDAGAWLLGMAEQPQFIESGGKVIVQPNFTILALEPISDAVLSDLDHFAESQGGERAITYHLTRESLYRGQQSGWNAPRAIQFLEEHQGGPIPANVRRSLEEWEASHRRITFHRNKCVLQFADDEAQSESADALHGLHPRKLGPRVRGDDVGARALFELIEGGTALDASATLRKAGWVPTLQAATDQATEGILRAGDDGTITLTQPAPSVFALGRLDQLIDPTRGPSPKGEGAGRLRITANSVRAALSKNISLDQLLATLAELHAGPISAKLEQKIREWAQFFGQASLKPVTLLELSSVDVLANLLDDKEVGKYLTLVEGSSMPLALVESDHADEVRQMLRERGIRLD